MCVMNILNLRNFCSSIDLQLLLYFISVGEALVYGLAGITYVCALVAFNKASERYEEEGSDESRQEEKQITLVLETEAMIQIFGIVMFFIVSAVMVNGVVEVKKF